MDQVYRLIVDLSSRGSLEPQIGRLGKASEGLESSLGGVSSMASSLGGAIGGVANSFVAIGDKIVDIGVGLAKVGAVAAGGALAYGVMHLNNELEKTKISLGGIFSAQGVTGSLTSGLDLAGDVMTKMRKDAAALPGEFKDLVNIFKFSATPGFQAGASVDRLEKLSANAMAASAALGVPMEQAAREMGMLLQGRAGAHNVLGNLLGLSGASAESFNKASGAGRLDTVEAALAKYAGLNDVFATSFDAISSTLVDNVKKFGTVVTSGLFERVKSVMRDANGWFDRNEGAIDSFGQKLSDGLVTAFEFGRMKILEWWPAMQEFGRNAFQEMKKVWSVAEPIIAALEPKMKHAIADPSLFSHLEKAGMLYGGLKIGGAIAPSGSTLASVGGGIVKGLGSLGAEGGLVGLALAAGAVVALGIGAVQLAGAFRILTDESNGAHEMALYLADSIRNHLGSAMEQVGRLADVMGPVLGKVADAFGGSLLIGLEIFAATLEGVATIVTAVAETIQTVWNEKVAPLVRLGTGFDVNWGDPMGSGEAGPGQRATRKGDMADAFYEGTRRADQANSTKTGAGGGGGGTTMHVQITIAETTDPSRLARLTVERMKELRERANTTPYRQTPLRQGIL